MGITSIAVRLLMEEAKSRPFSGKVLQLGRQDIHLDRAALQALAAEHGFELRPSTGPSISDKTFFGALGFDTVQSLDAADYQGADIVHDLNTVPPPQPHRSFDVVLDVGTLEHVFNVPTALTNVHDLLKVGGRFIALLPSSNHVDHGFYSFSPVLFADYFHANAYRVDQCYLITFDGDWFHSDYRIHRYTPSPLLHELGSQHLFRNMAVATWVVATKLPESTSDRQPIQYHYRRNAWRSGPTQALDARSAFLGTRLTRLKDRLKDTHWGGQLMASPRYDKVRRWLIRNVLLPRKVPKPDIVYRD